MADSPEMKTYILGLRGGKLRKVTVPASWKVTFGPLVVGRKEGSTTGSTLALRFYETKENQRAIFTDVEWFRDSSIQIEETRTRRQDQTLYRDTPNGRKTVVVGATATEWVNPDEPQQAGEEYTAPLLTAETTEGFFDNVQEAPQEI